MNIAHGDIACSKVSLDNWIDGGMNNVHRCPKCASIFEKMSGCSEMECSVCHYKWCWVCGLKYESGWHILMLFPCQLINMTVLNESLNKCCRFFMIILYLLVIPTVFLIFFPIMIILMICWEAYENNRHKSNCLGTTLCMMYCNKSHRLKEKVYIYIIKVIFISIPRWILVIIVCLVAAFLTLIIFIIPMYIFSFVSLCRMAYWWTKNKRIKAKKLTEEQLNL